MTSVPISELKQRTGQTLDKVVIDREDLVIEKYGRAYAVILSMERYQQLTDAAKARAREQLISARKELQDTFSDYSEEEIEELVSREILDSRQERAGL